MSVFRQMETKITNEKSLESGLKKLGYEPVITGSKQQVRGHGNEKLMADVVLKKEQTKLGGDIGFEKKADGTYSLVLDTWVTKIDTEKFIKQVSDSYAREEVRKKMAAFPSFRGVETVGPDSEIVLTYTEVTA